MYYQNKYHLPAFLILLTFFVQLWISKDLWVSDSRELPFIPFFDFLPLNFGRTGDLILIFLMVLSFLLLLKFPEQKKYLLIFVVPSLLLILEDSLRLQPWFFLDIAMLSVIIFEKELKPENVIRVLQWIIIAVYLWGGIHKLNIGFAWETFPWFTQPLGIGDHFYIGLDNLNKFDLPAQNFVAYSIPAFEILTALFLFIPRFRKLGITGSIITHLVSLYAIGPFGHNWNEIVWPWNIQMPLLCFLLFAKTEIEPFNEFIFSQKKLIRSKTGIAILSLFIIGPLLSMFGKWDKGLSMYLYSGNNDELEFYFEGFEPKLVETTMADHLYYDPENKTSNMQVEYWVMDRMKVPMYGSPRYMQKVGKHLCSCLEHPEKGGIKILLRSGFSSRQDTLKIPCKDL